MSAAFSVDFIAKATKGQVKSRKFSTFDRIETDSRVDLKGSFFVALKGERFDGHQFVAKAVESGAHGALVHEWRPEFEGLKEKATILLVQDTLVALQLLARAWREHCGFKVVGITGSNGKTTTKELAYQLLKDHFKTSASPGSFNNHWGVPLSLLKATPEHEVVLQEMGMNHKGEIRDLCLIARPDVVVVTNVGTAHIGELGSVQAIKEAKNEIYVNSPQAKHIYNLDNEHTLELCQTAMKEGFPKEKILTFSSFNPKAQVFLRANRVDVSGLHVSGQISGVSGEAKIQAFGRQTVVNLMAASSVALALGMSAKEIFSRFEKIHLQSWGRNQWISGDSGPTIIFDGYNANPDSMKMLLKNLFELELEGRKAFVFGDMRELGERSESAHEEVAELAGQIGLHAIWYMGDFGEAVKRALKRVGYKGKLIITSDHDELEAKKLYEMLESGDLVALKASRGSRIERVLSSWGVDGF